MFLASNVRHGDQRHGQRLPTTVNGAWNVPGSGTWSTGKQLGRPQAPGVRASSGDTATFGSVIGSHTATVTLDTPVSVGALTFSNTASGGYMLSGAGSNGLTFNNGGSGATDHGERGGASVIDAPVTLSRQRRLTVSGSGTLAFGSSSSITDNGGGSGLTMNGAGGQLILSGSDNYSGGTSVEAGTLIAASTPPCPTSRA